MKRIGSVCFGLFFLSLMVGCGEDPLVGVCKQAADKMMACMGTEIPFDESSCLSAGESFELASQIASMACADIQKLKVVRGEGGTICVALAGLFGFCKPAFPTFSCASDLGQAVADAVCKSNYFQGMVPSEWLYTSRNAWGEPWVDSPAIFTGNADLIAGARFEADLETYEWDPSFFDKNDPSWTSDPTMVLVDGVQRLQERLKNEEATTGLPVVPVKVRFIIDGRHPWGFFGGLAVNKIRALALQIRNANIEPRYVEVQLAVHQHLTWGALHSKLLVVDGYKAVLTGANPQRQQFFGRHWHDSAYLVTGEIGVAMQHDFDDSWKRSSEVESCRFDNFEEDADCKLKSTSTIVHPPEVENPNLEGEPLLANACLPMIAASRRPFNPWNLNLFAYDNPQNAAFLALIENASQVIKIETPDMNDVVKDAILAAVKRGIEVRIILSQGFNSWPERSGIGPFTIGGANEDSVPELYDLLADPTACGRLQIRWYTSNKGSPPIYGQNFGASHTKYMTVDGKVAIVGSANQDMVSWAFVQETNVLLDDPEATASYDQMVFDLDWEKAEGSDVFVWARGIIDGTVEVSEELNALLYDDAKGWAAKLLESCGL